MKSQQCAVCGPAWKTREPKQYGNGTMSIPMIFGMRLLTRKNTKRVHITMCDLHGNNHIPYTRTVNGNLQVRNIKTMKWRSAARVGEIMN